MQFIKGDRVLRTGETFLGCVKGQEYTVAAVGPGYGASLQALWLEDVPMEMPSGWGSVNFEFVSRSIMEPIQEPVLDASIPHGRHEETPADGAIHPDHYMKYALEPMRIAVENAAKISKDAARWVLLKDLFKYSSRADDKWRTEGYPQPRDYNKSHRILEMLEDFDKDDPDWWMSRNATERRAFP